MAIMNITLDTNVILAFSNQESDKNQDALKRLFDSIHSRNHSASISSITVAEIFAIVCRAGEARKAAEIIYYLKEAGVKIIDVTEQIAKNAGLLKSKYPGMKGFSYGDAIIASTCIETLSILITFEKNLNDIKEIEVRTPEEVFSD